MSCEHSEQRLARRGARSAARRAIRGGSVQYVYQCVVCGRSMNQPIAHAIIERDYADQVMPEFDESLEESYVKRVIEESEGRARDKRAAFFERYNAYLRSPEWAEKRRRVLARCKRVCEGCGAAPATEVHHLTYEHVCAELLFELVGLCKSCHDRVHAEPSDR